MATSETATVHAPLGLDPDEQNATAVHHRTEPCHHQNDAVNAHHSLARGGTLVGRLIRLEGLYEPLVEFSLGNERRTVTARSIVKLEPGDVGREAVLVFERTDSSHPIILGLLRGPTEGSPDTEIVADGERIQISAEKEIVLRCGKASLHLTRSGKVIIRGEYVLSRSTGVNSVQGGSVHIN